MFKRIVLVLSTLTFAFLILGISFLRVSSVSYAFYDSPRLAQANNGTKIDAGTNIDYFFPYEGKILPDNTLWPLKALRDRFWLIITTNTSKKAELMLLFSDKRLLMSKSLFEKGKPEPAFSTLTKAEKYLEEASNLNDANKKKGMDTASFDLKLVTASLKHRQIIEDLFFLAPEDAKPGITRVLDYSKNVYKVCRDNLQSKGATCPENPFIGE